MNLRAYVDLYVLERELSEQYADALYEAVMAFERWLARNADVSDLNDLAVNRYIKYRSETDGSKWTTRGHRSRLMALWNAAASSDPPLIPQRKRVRPVSRPGAPPVAWTVKEVQILLDAIRANCRGVFRRSRVPRLEFWLCFVLAAYESGLRLADLLALRIADVADDGRIIIAQAKTNKSIVTGVRPATAVMMRALANGRATVFGGAICRHGFFERFKAIAKVAGLHGTSRWLRRSSGSYVEMLAPGTGHLHLGNTRDVFLKHYASPSIVTPRSILPPEVA